MKHKTALPMLIAQSGLISNEGMISFDTDRSTLDMDAAALSQFTNSQICSTEDDVLTALEELEQLDADQLNNANYTRGWRELSDKLAKDMAICIGNLKETQSEVDKLALRYSFFRASAISMDPILDNTVSNKEDVVHHMKQIDWKELEGIDEYVVKSEVAGRVGKTAEEELSNEDYAYLLNQLAFANKYNEVNFTEMSLSDEAYGRIYTQLRQNTSLNDTQIAQVLNTVCDFDKFKCVAANRFCAEFLNGEGSHINKALDMVYVWSRAIPILSSQELLDVSNSTMSNIMQRVNVVNAIVDLLAYGCVNYRRSVWKDALLVNGPQINADNLADFTDVGGTINDIVKYHNYYFDGIPVPSNGISTEKLFNGIKSVEDQIDKEIEDKKLDVQKKLRNVESSAFLTTANEWMNNNPQYFVKMTYDEKQKFIRMIDGTGTSVEDKFYQLIMNTVYAGSETYQLFNELNRAYAEHIDNYKNLSSEDVENLNCQVYAKIISNKLLESGIVK